MIGFVVAGLVAVSADALVSKTSPGILEAVGDMLRGAPVVETAPNSAADKASAFVSALNRLPAPSAPYMRDRVDPHPVGDVSACDRGYQEECPSQFVSIGAVLGGETTYCAAGSTYQGPCDDIYDFSAYTTQGKARWSRMCQANWPCVDCERDISSPCPSGWSQTDGERMCVPTDAYEGPCPDPEDFSYYTTGMLREWSSAFGACWECGSR